MAKPASNNNMSRKQHILEFRQEILKLAERIGIATAARKLSLYESQLYVWWGKLHQQMIAAEHEG
ncbi:hypothetical protein JZD35_004914 [Salmonella enterica subsp. enterica serovar Teko]|nr:hypothetical protein [Salmonella enterica subsp. enterica serovar Teko]